LTIQRTKSATFSSRLWQWCSATAHKFWHSVLLTTLNGH